MAKITAEELKTILENHEHWLKRDCEGWEKMRADLYRAGLSGANLHRADLYMADISVSSLSRADLSRANLSGANLTETNLAGTDLYRADLSGAGLSGADLSVTNLSRADLSGANLYRADLSRADLSGADLSRADLSGADLSRANLSGANLHRADLSGADLSRANLSGANLHRAKLLDAMNVPYIPMTCPEEGSFIGWKKASGKIVCLGIPEDAKRSSATSRKCRCNKAKVLSITYINGDNCELTEVASNYDRSFIYKIGETVTADDFDDDRWNECSTGIHFFINRMEAVQYGG